MPSAPAVITLDVPAFRQRLMLWYREYARDLPWRRTRDPYRVWVSEIMLQQTRVAAVIEHYHDFLRRFPTVEALADASESDVLAAWSGLGYYRRARMMHQAAKKIGSSFPVTSEALKALPGIGDYTSAAVASICAGESIAVIDGNVERVLLRVTGRPEENTVSSRVFLRQHAAALVPPRKFDNATNAAGDHNQAMMELGATICLPRGPLCLQCPVYGLCKTQGEHVTLPKGKQRVMRAAYLLFVRTLGDTSEVLLERRPDEASIMAGMYELPQLPLESIEGREPLLRVRHAITTTNYQVEVFSPSDRKDTALQRSIPVSRTTLLWTPHDKLQGLPLTGLARKVLQKKDIFPSGKA